MLQNPYLNYYYYIVLVGVVIVRRYHPIVPGGFLFDITIRIAHNRLGKNILQSRYLQSLLLLIIIKQKMYNIKFKITVKLDFNVQVINLVT